MSTATRKAWIADIIEFQHQCYRHPGILPRDHFMGYAFGLNMMAWACGEITDAEKDSNYKAIEAWAHEPKETTL